MEFNPISCLHPRTVYNKYTGQLVSVPCGKCSACLIRRSSLWTARLREESACHPYTMFVTLTYDDSHLPLVSLDSLADSFFTDNFNKAVSDSFDFINYHRQLIPCLSVRDLQLFFKRLRSKISYYHGTQTTLRYFVAGEYGPTTFRPHYHMLLWFDNPNLVQSIKNYIYEAWKSFTCHKSLSSFLRRNKCVFVHGSAESYVAGYLNCFTYLPEILKQKPFRPFHLQSSNPPIGAIRILKESLEQLLSGNVTTVSLRRQSSGDVVELSLWRGLENRFFPKCIGFSRSTPFDRRTLYKISLLCPTVGSTKDYKSFEKWFLPQWFSSDYPFTLVRKLCGDSSHDDFPSKECRNSLHRLYNISRQVVALSSILNISVESYVARIETYYIRKDYVGLVSQLKFQEKLSISPLSSLKLAYYPFMVDLQFYDNGRNLSSSSWYSLVHQFGLDDKDFVNFFYNKSPVFENRKSFCDRIFYDSHKVRIKKDYVANHPECMEMYRSVLRPQCLI